MPSRTAFEAVALAVYNDTDHDKMPKGWIGYETGTAGVNIGSTDTDIVSVTCTIPADRLLKVSCRGSLTDTDNDSVGGIVSVEMDGVDKGRVHRHPDLVENSFMGGYVLINDPSTGSHTFTLVGVTTSGTFDTFGSYAILVEDIGPAS